VVSEVSPFPFSDGLDTRDVYQALYLAFVPLAAELDHAIEELILGRHLGAARRRRTMRIKTVDESMPKARRQKQTKTPYSRPADVRLATPGAMSLALDQ
jgi:hypothetical protein